ncbi:MAG: hypothetical protein Q8M16_23580 [Pirellulaceae bacterium]|nr:hypothetical protein [Pirellulaceae bacterium]
MNHRPTVTKVDNKVGGGGTEHLCLECGRGTDLAATEFIWVEPRIHH